MGAMTGFAGGILPSLGMNYIQQRRAERSARRRARAQSSADAQALAQLQQRQAADMAQREQQAAEDRAALAMASAKANDERMAALRRASARQRARFGASGVANSSGGSREAVLLGLVNESEDERKVREDMDRLRAAAIDSDLSRVRSLNLLQATQLSERQALRRMSARGDDDQGGFAGLWGF